MSFKLVQAKMPGLRAPAFFVTAAMLGIAMPLPAVAQQIQPLSVIPPASALPVPSQLDLSKMLWSTMMAVDHANRSGNYSVLRDMASQGFQINNTAATLAQVFVGLREGRVDLSNTVLVPPTYAEAPRMVDQTVLQVRGYFQIRPNAIFFDVYYVWEQGMWKLHGIDIQPAQMMEAMPETAAPQPAPQPDRR